MSAPTAKLITTNKGKQMTREQLIRYNELMRIAKGDDYMSEAEFNELAMLIKMNGYK